MPPVALGIGADELFNKGKITNSIGGMGTPGKNNFEPTTYGTTPDYNSNDFNYGGNPNGAANAANMYGNTAGTYTGSAMGNFGQAYNEFGAADQDRNAAYGSRGQEQDALGLIADRAKGNNLISNQVAAQQAGQLAAEQESLANSARGPAALALAQQGRAANTSAGQSQIATNAAIAGAQEKLANEQAYLGGASNIRGQDIGQMGATTNLGSALVGSGSAQGQLGLGYSGLQNKVNEDQLQGSETRQQVLSGSQQTGQQLQAGVSTANAANEWKPYEMALGAGQGIGSLATAPGHASDPDAKSLISALGLGPAGGDVAENDALHKSLASPGGDMKISGGGLDVMGSLHAINGHVNDAVKNPGWGTIASDPSAKQQILSLYEPEGMQLHMSPEGHAGYQAVGEEQPKGASLSGAAPKYSHAEAPPQESAPKAKAERRMTPGELNAEADRMLQSIHTQKEAAMARGPAVQSQGVPPAWLQQYMSPEQPASDPKAKSGIVDTSPEAKARRGAALHSAIETVQHVADKAQPVLRQMLHLPEPESEQDKTIRANQEHIDNLQYALAHEGIDSLRKQVADAHVSDPRGKVLGGVHDNEIADTLDETPAVSYRYKSEYFEPDTTKPGERQAGFLTTDLKKTPLGAAVVEERPDGYEGYNTHRMIGLEFAGLRNVHERLRDLEAIIAEKHKKGG